MSTESVELRLYLENDSELYRQQTWPIIQNIARKMKSGKYDHAKAPKLWGYLVESAAKKYAKEFSVGSDWNKIFSVATRRELAQELADDYRDKIRNGEYSIALGRKKNPAPAQSKKSFMGMRVRIMRFEAGTWLESEEAAYPRGGKTRDGEARLGDSQAQIVKVKAGVPDTYFSIPATAKVPPGTKSLKGYLTIDGGVLVFHALKAAQLRAKNPVRPLKGAKRRAKPGAVNKLLAKARETYKALNPGKRVPASLASKKKRRQKNPTKARRCYCVDQVQNGLWYQVGHFSTKANALKFAHNVADKTGKRCRVVRTYSTGDYPVKK